MSQTQQRTTSRTDTTQIQVTREVKQHLFDRKQRESDTYDDVLRRMLDLGS